VTGSTIHERLFAGLLGEAGTATPDQVAARAGVSPAAAAETLSALERQGLLDPMPGGAYRAGSRLDSRELRELYPVVLMLEAIAVRDAPAYSQETIGRMRTANQRLRDAHDAREGSEADDEFHRELTACCGNPALLDVIEPVRHALLPYERVYFAGADRRARSADQHDAIVDLIAGGDQTGAADLVRENFTTALADLQAELDRR
jgi:DNA-binding GntR family transcriptional regulator